VRSLLESVSIADQLQIWQHARTPLVGWIEDLVICLSKLGSQKPLRIENITCHATTSDCEGCDGEVLLWLNYSHMRHVWTDLFISQQPIQLQTKPSLRFVASTTHSMACVCVCA